MRRKLLLRGLLALICSTQMYVPMCLAQYVTGEQDRVIRRPGESKSPDGGCVVQLRANPLGGALDLSLGTKRKRVFHDVNGMAWLSGSILVFTVSPVYGKPGIYTFDCKSDQTKRIVSPRTLNKAYPDGADFFELQSVRRGTSPRILFYYAPDVDKVDFRDFRGPANLFQVNSDGSNFKRAT
jgi:hypothetical protein